MKKKILSLLLVLVLLVSTTPAVVSASEDTVPEGLEYINYGTYIEISGYSGTASVLKIPESIEGLPVTRIGYSFQNCPSLTKVILPGTIKTIYYDAFEDFPSLEAIEFSAQNEMYEALDGVLFSKDMSTLILYPAAKKGDYTIPNSVGYIEDSAFRSCTGLTSLELPQGYKSRIDNGMFGHCSNLKEVTIPASVTDIHSLAFMGCSSLTSIKVDADNSSYCSIDGVLFDKEGKKLVILPGGISGHYIIPENVEIAYHAFYDAKSLTKVTISNNVSLDSDDFVCWGHIFYNSPLLTEIEVDPAHPYYSVSNNILYNKAGTSLLYCPQSKSGIVTVSDGVTQIGVGAFANCGEVTGIVLPSSITEIFPAFNHRCKKLTDVYYAGTEEEWEKINIYTDLGIYEVYYDLGRNKALFDASMHYDIKTFEDVPSSSFYYEPVLWALGSNITSGTTPTEFSPYDACLRSQVVTFLWRAAGEPKAESAVNPFVDVKPGDYYYDAVLWAVEKGITYGADDTHFEPNGVCNRSQVVSFLYRAFDTPSVEGAGNPFQDVPDGAWYAAAVQWAVKEGIAYGLSESEFGPNDICNRSQVVTFLHRAYVN